MTVFNQIKTVSHKASTLNQRVLIYNVKTKKEKHLFSFSVPSFDAQEPINLITQKAVNRNAAFTCCCYSSVMTGWKHRLEWNAGPSYRFVFSSALRAFASGFRVKEKEVVS